MASTAEQISHYTWNYWSTKNEDSILMVLG